MRVNAEHPDFGGHADRMNEASLACWEEIQQRDLPGLATAVDASHCSQCVVVENHCPHELRAFIDREPALAAMIMGAGGGGYVLFIAETIPPDGIPIRVKRSDY